MFTLKLGGLCLEFLSLGAEDSELYSRGIWTLSEFLDFREKTILVANKRFGYFFLAQLRK